MQVVKFFQVLNLPPLEQRKPNSFYFVKPDGDEGEVTEVYLTGSNGATYRFGTTEMVAPEIEWDEIIDLPATFPPSAHNHDDRYFTETELNSTLATKADLVGGKIPTAQLPGLAIGERFSAANEAAMLALTAQQGDVAIRADQSNAKYLLLGDDAATLSNWLNLSDAAGDVTSVNGHTGAVVLSKEDLELENVPNVDARNRATHTGTQDAATISGTKTAVFISNFAASVLAATLTGLSTASDAVISAGDSVVSALGKLQAQITALGSSKADKANVTRTFTGTTDTLLAADVGKEVRASNAQTKVVTVPVTATLGTNFVCAVYNYGAGALTFSPAVGVTLRGNDGSLAQYKTVTIRAVAANEYQIMGEMS